MYLKWASFEVNLDSSTDDESIFITQGTRETQEVINLDRSINDIDLEGIFEDSKDSAIDTSLGSIHEVPVAMSVRKKLMTTWKITKQSLRKLLMRDCKHIIFQQLT